MLSDDIEENLNPAQYLLTWQVFWLPDFRNSIQKTANTH